MNEGQQSDEFRARVDKNLQDMADALKEIKVALVGNDVGTTGIVPRLAAVETKQQRMERIYLVGTGIVLALGGAYTLIRDWWVGHN